MPNLPNRHSNPPNTGLFHPLVPADIPHQAPLTDAAQTCFSCSDVPLYGKHSAVYGHSLLGSDVANLKRNYAANLERNMQGEFIIQGTYAYCL